MRIAYTNLVDTATAPTVLTENLLYPVENLQNGRLASRWRSTTPTAQTVVVDLGAAADVNTVAILGHNITTAATLTISANATDEWSAPTYTTSLTHSTGAILKFLSAAESYRYWEFAIDDDANSDGYIEAGRIWLGTYLAIDPASLLSFSVTKRRSDTVVYGRDRQKYATEGVGWRAFDLSFPRTSGTALTNVLTMIDAVGLHDSVIFCNFDSRRDYEIVEPCYCSISEEVTFRHTRRMKFEYTLTLEEDR